MQSEVKRRRSRILDNKSEKCLYNLSVWYECSYDSYDQCPPINRMKRPSRAISCDSSTDNHIRDCELVIEYTIVGRSYVIVIALPDITLVIQL